MTLAHRDTHGTPGLPPVGFWPVIPAHRTGRVHPEFLARNPEPFPKQKISP